MKKFLSIVIILAILFTIAFCSEVNAAELTTLDITIDKIVVNPGDTITITAQFGEDLGAYTFEYSYDDNLLEYVSVDDGTANDTGDKVIVTYFDTTGGLNPKTSASITFRAKSDITTSNPTEFLITAEGLANADGSITFDDVTIPIVQNFIVEPQYEMYNIAFTYEGNVIKEVEKNMRLTISSNMGKNYEHVRILAEVTKPDGTTAKLFGIDDENLEHDLIESGWGPAQGFSIGGVNMEKILDLRGIFSNEGTYEITFSVIDRDDSDSIITQNTFNISVLPEEINEVIIEEPVLQDEELPTVLPKTGYNIYVIATILILIVLTFAGIVLKEKTKQYK